MIDAHTHLGLSEFVVRPIPADKLKRPAFQDKMTQTREELLGSMRANSVDRAVVFAFPLAEVDAERANAYVLDAWKAEPDKIIPFALLDDEPAAWAARGFRGFKQHFLLEPERFDAKRVYKAIEGTGLPLMTHFATKKIVESAEAILAIAPDIKLIIAHMGRCEPFTGKCVMENIAGLKRYPNVYFETSTVRDAPVFKEAVAAVGAHRICFGSDLPFGSKLGGDPLGEEIRIMKSAIDSEEERAAIFGGTILRILGEE